MHGCNETVNFQSQKVIFQKNFIIIGPVLRAETLNLGNHMLFYDNVKNR